MPCREQRSGAAEQRGERESPPLSGFQCQASREGRLSQSQGETACSSRAEAPWAGLTFCALPPRPQLSSAEFSQASTYKAGSRQLIHPKETPVFLAFLTPNPVTKSLYPQPPRAWGRQAPAGTSQMTTRKVQAPMEQVCNEPAGPRRHTHTSALTRAAP